MIRISADHHTTSKLFVACKYRLLYHELIQVEEIISDSGIRDAAGISIPPTFPRRALLLFDADISFSIIFIGNHAA